MRGHFYRPQRSCGEAMFSQACVKISVHKGGGCTWQGACMVGGEHGSGGVCVAEGTCRVGGVYMAGGHVWQWETCGRGVCVIFGFS